jgi:ATP-dependent RNA helicase DHX8/PRP22
LTSGKEVVIHPSSVLHGRNPPPALVVYTEVLTTSRAYIRGVTIADAMALQELCPQFYGQPG